MRTTRTGAIVAVRLAKTGERLIPSEVGSRDEYLSYLRHVWAYEYARTVLADREFVLDLGCGEGYGSVLLLSVVGAVVGVDVDATAVDHATQNYGTSKCIFRKYDGRKLPFDDDAFDAAVSFQVIEHVPHDRLFVSEVARVLKPRGMFILTTPNGANRLKPGHKPWNQFHVREYSPGELEALLNEDFSDVKVCGVTASPDVYRLEMDRIRQSLRIVSLDPLKLRRLIPKRLRPIIARLVRRITRRNDPDEKTPDWAERYSLHDYFVTEERVADSLDLLGICRK